MRPALSAREITFPLLLGLTNSSRFNEARAFCAGNLREDQDHDDP